MRPMDWMILERGTELRVNILETNISDSKLEKAALNFENRENMMPYLIMNVRTFEELKKKKMIGHDGKGGYDFFGWNVLINNNLSFGDVDIR